MDERTREAMDIVRAASVWSAGAGFIPLPAVDIAAIASIQVKMIRDLSRLYDKEFNTVRAKALSGAILGGVIPYLLSEGSEGFLLSFAKTVPVIGPLASLAALPGFAAASTYAVGKVFAQHLAGGGSLFDFEPSAKQRDARANGKNAPGKAEHT